MRIFGVIIFFTFHFAFVNAQVWAPVGSGIQGNGGGPIAEYNGTLWIGGTFDSAGKSPSRNIAEWNNSNWLPIANGFDWGTSCGAVYNSELYVGGEYDSVAGKPIRLLARWNSTQWDSVGVLGLAGNIVQSLDTFKGKLYAAGWIGEADGFLVNNIASWDGTKWDSLDNGVGTIYYGQIECMCVYNGILYVGGDFDTVNRQRAWNLAGWNGSNWITFDTVVNNSIQCMAVYKGELYIGGWFSRAGGVSVRSVAKWNGTTWSDVGGGVEYTIYNSNYSVSGMAVYNGDLYIGGHFDTAGGILVHNIAKWDGSTWSDVDMGVSGGNFPNIDAFAVYDSSLYIGGEFASAGGLPAKNIAKWTTPNAIEELSNSNYCKIYPNPNNGIFTLSLSNITKKCNVEIYNILGENVLTETLCSTQGGKVVDLTNQPNGVYFYRVIAEDAGLIGEGKVVVQK